MLVVVVMAGMVGLALKWVRLAPNGTKPGLFSDHVPDLSNLGVQSNVLKSDLKKSQICPISGPI